MAFSPVQSKPKGPSQEYLLLDYLQRLGRSVDGRMAVHIHLSRLRPQNRQEHHVRIAATTFESLSHLYDGQVFTLGSSDLVFICKDAPIEDIDATVLKIRYLFNEDPLTFGEEEEDMARFSTWYNIETQHQELLDLIKQMHRERERKNRVSAAKRRDLDSDQGGLKMLTPEQLGKLENFLARADLSNLMRRQQVCAITPSNPTPQAIFQELYISIDKLRDSILPDYDLASSLWLFRHLTQTLDLRMLQVLIHNDDSTIDSSFSINMNVQTILSPSFLQFDNSLKAVARGTVVIELQPIDIFSDMGAYMFARDFMRERGYRIALDGLNHQILQFIDREQLGFDLLKLIWSPEMADDNSGTRLDTLKEHVDRCGRARLIIARCDSDEAVRFGQSLGSTVYQGHYVDRLLANS